jgi:hypothetical protein
MHPLSTDLVSQACRIFFSLAYPGGEDAVPEKKRHLLHLPPGLLMLDFVEAVCFAPDCCQVIRAKSGGDRALLLRLGCCHYPNLKLKTQIIEDGRESEWLFSVDTHDAFSSTSFLPPADHRDAARWRMMQADNCALKQKIEAAWEEAGLLTFNALLRRDLPKVLPSFS